MIEARLGPASTPHPRRPMTGRERREKCLPRPGSNVFRVEGQDQRRTSMKTRGPRGDFGGGAAGQRIGLLGLAAQIALGASAVAQPAAAARPQTPLMDRQKEIALALSACPQSA